MTILRHLPATALLTFLALSPAAAQPVQSSEDCRLPGGCGTSGKPGGVERAPETVAPTTRGIQRPKAAAPAAPAAPAPAIAPLPPAQTAPPSNIGPPSVPVTK